MDISKTKDGFFVSTKSIDVCIGDDSKKADVYLLNADATNLPKEGLVFNGPGEYEVKNTMIDGVKFENGETSFCLRYDGLAVAYITPTDTVLTDKVLEAIDGVDVAILPTTGDKAETTTKIIAQLEPKIVIPYGYNPEQLQQLNTEFGSEHETTAKLKIAKKDLGEDTQKLVVLE